MNGSAYLRCKMCGMGATACECNRVVNGIRVWSPNFVSSPLPPTLRRREERRLARADAHHGRPHGGKAS